MYACNDAIKVEIYLCKSFAVAHNKILVAAYYGILKNPNKGGILMAV
jgi:hypothetical protein